MKVGIYNEPSGSSLGGSEISVAVLAEAMSQSHEVDIVHHRRSLILERLAEFSRTNLGAVRSRYVAPEPYSFGISHNPLQRYQEAQVWHAALSEPYDLFINFTHHAPPFCHAPKGVLMVLFPLDEAPYIQSQKDVSSSADSFLWGRLKGLYHGWEWEQRMKSYQLKMANSHFTQGWTKRRWGIDSQVVYPPTDVDFRIAGKANIILSVGRFTTEGHSKKQLEMVTAFQQMEELGRQGWQYFCVGGLGDSPADRAYFEGARQIGMGCRAQVLANVDRPRLRQFYGQARIFWHAAGYGEDDDRPELVEHFGKVTVEAMAAGCVPIVINKGGQREIVQHGVDGFLWNTTEELKQYTRLIICDEQLRARMAAAARARAQVFGREEFVTRFLKLLCFPPPI